MKRLLDVLISSLLLLLLFPLMVVVAALVRVLLGEPVLFKQWRPGIHGKLFKMYKFRSMLDSVDSSDHLLPDEQRLTRFGKFLRSKSLDELPELWNVLLGDMSLVGPRPLLEEYLPLYSQRQARRHEVRPGVTGWAQANGRNAIDWEQKLELDVWYVDNHNLILDIRILIKTVVQVLQSRDVNHDNHATMPVFRGKGD